MGKSSREKGKRGERELASVLKEYGWDCRRGQQYAGINGDADVIGLPWIHIECKRVEKLNIYDAIDQSRRDAKSDELPAVFHRKNNCDWLVTMRLSDWIQIYTEWEASHYHEFVVSNKAECQNKEDLKRKERADELCAAIKMFGMKPQFERRIEVLILFHKPPVETMEQLERIVQTEKIRGLGAKCVNSFMDGLALWKERNGFGGIDHE